MEFRIILKGAVSATLQLGRDIYKVPHVGEPFVVHDHGRLRALTRELKQVADDDVLEVTLFVVRE